MERPRTVTNFLCPGGISETFATTCLLMLSVHTPQAHCRESPLLARAVAATRVGLLAWGQEAVSKQAVMGREDRPLQYRRLHASTRYAEPRATSDDARFDLAVHSSV